LYSIAAFQGQAGGYESFELAEPGDIVSHGHLSDSHFLRLLEYKIKGASWQTIVYKIAHS